MEENKIENVSRENRFRIKEAILRARATNKDFKQIEIAKKLYPDCGEKIAAINFSRLVNNKKKALTFDEIKFLCENLNVSPNFLMGYDIQTNHALERIAESPAQSDTENGSEV